MRSGVRRQRPASAHSAIQQPRNKAQDQQQQHAGQHAATDQPATAWAHTREPRRVDVFVKAQHAQVRGVREDDAASVHESRTASTAGAVWAPPRRIKVCPRVLRVAQALINHSQSQVVVYGRYQLIR